MKLLSSNFTQQNKKSERRWQSNKLKKETVQGNREHVKNYKSRKFNYYMTLRKIKETSDLLGKEC